MSQQQTIQVPQEGSFLRKAYNRVFKSSPPSPSIIDDGSAYDGRQIKWPQIQFPERQGAGVQYPIQPKHYIDLYEIHKQETIFRTCTRALRQEIFRNGIEIRPNFWAKCKQCKKEYKNKIEGVTAKEWQFRSKGIKCPNCNTGKMFPPDEKEYELLKSFYDKINENDDKLIDLCEPCEDDLQIADNCYIILIKDYVLDRHGNIDSWMLKEVVRGHPILMRVVSDRRGHKGNVYYTCLEHRNFITTAPKDKCGFCGKTKLHGVWYVATNSGGKDIDQAYIKGEVIQEAKYRRGENYGYSVVLTLWHYLIASLVMIQMIADYYRERRWPTGVLVYPTLNPKSMEEMADKWREKTKKDKQYIPWLSVDPNNGAGRVEFVRLMDNLQEMQYVEVREEIGRRIGAMIGVEPILTGDLTQGGGLNSESLQVKVTNRVVKYGQERIWNKGIFPELQKALGVKGWHYFLVESEEEDKMAELERNALEVNTARVMFEMGFIGELDDNGKFIFPRKPMKEIETGGIDNKFGDPKSGGGFGGSQRTDSLQERDDKAQEGKRAVEREREQGHNDRQTGDVRERKPASPTAKSMDNVIKAPINDVLSVELYNRIVDGLRSLISIEMRALKARKGNNLTREDAVEVLDRIKEQMTSQVDSWAFKFFAAMYIYGKNSILLTQDELDTASEAMASILDSVSTNDQEVLDAIELFKPFKDTFLDFSLTTSNKFRSMVEDTFRERQSASIDTLVSQMQNITSEETYKLERIARSESQIFALAGREKGYKDVEADRGQKLLYVWNVYKDDRTSRQCREIERRVQVLTRDRSTNGVPLDELKQIVFDVQSEMNGSKWIVRDWLVHPNCRSRFLRVV